MATPWARLREARRDRAESTEVIAQYITDRVNDLIENHQLADDAPIPLDVIERIAQEARAEALRTPTQTVRQMRDEQALGPGTAVTDQNHLTLHLSREHASEVLDILEAEAQRRAQELGVTFAQWAESSQSALALAMTCYAISDWLASPPGS